MLQIKLQGILDQKIQSLVFCFRNKDSVTEEYLDHFNSGLRLKNF